MHPRQIIRICLVSAIGLAAWGCGPTAYKITPVSPGQTLGEKVVWKDPGLVFEKIALVEIDGLISNSSRGGLLGQQENPVALVVEKLQKAGSDRWVKAVILRINSPGGTVTASDMIYQQVKLLQEGKAGKGGKPVIAVMMDVAASGAYYIACGAEKIVAHPTTITGSIGVIMYTFNVNGLFDKLGIGSEAIKSGAKKDAGSPFRPITAQERKVFQDIIDQFYGRFLNVVKTERKSLDQDNFTRLADGRVFSGPQAKELGLVDCLGNLNTAIELAKQAAGLSKARVVMYHRPADYRANVYSRARLPGPITQFNLFNLTASQFSDLQGPQFMYLWTGR